MSILIASDLCTAKHPRGHRCTMRHTSSCRPTSSLEHLPHFNMMRKRVSPASFAFPPAGQEIIIQPAVHYARLASQPTVLFWRFLVHPQNAFSGLIESSIDVGVSYTISCSFTSIVGARRVRNTTINIPFLFTGLQQLSSRNLKVCAEETEKAPSLVDHLALFARGFIFSFVNVLHFTLVLELRVLQIWISLQAVPGWREVLRAKVLGYQKELASHLAISAAHLRDMSPPASVRMIALTRANRLWWCDLPNGDRRHPN